MIMTLEEKAEESSKKAFCVAHTNEDELIFKNGYLEGAKENEEQLKQAKELLEEFCTYRMYDCDATREDKTYEAFEELKEQAEQFLEEITE